MKTLLKVAFFCLIFCGISELSFGQSAIQTVAETKQDTLDWEKVTVLDEKITPTGKISKIRNDITGNIFTQNIDLPQFPGGPNQLYGFLVKNTKYPKVTRRKGISGKVLAKFTITETGKITDVEIVEGVHELLDQEALRVIRSMPNWIPGKLNGKPVPVQYNLPFQFNLRDSN